MTALRKPNSHIPVHLTGTQGLRGQPLRRCDKHGAEVPPEGGVDIGSKWYCAACWNRRIRSK